MDGKHMKYADPDIGVKNISHALAEKYEMEVAGEVVSTLQ